MSYTLNYLPHPTVFSWHPWVHLSGPRSINVFHFRLESVKFPIIEQTKYLKALQDFCSLPENIIHVPEQKKGLWTGHWSVCETFFSLANSENRDHLFVLPSAAWCSSALSIMILVSDSRDAAFVVNSVVRRSSLSSTSLRRASLLVARLWRAAPKCWMSPFSWSTLLRAAWRLALATGSLLASISSLSLLAQSVSSLPLT